MDGVDNWQADEVTASQETFCARRGGQWLSRDDLQAHLACLLRLDNVGMLLGAGASMGPLGGMTIATLWKHFNDTYSTSVAWLEENGFVAKGVDPNVEVLSDHLEVAALEWKRSSNPNLPALQRARADLVRAVVHAGMLNQEWWKSPEKVGLEVEELKHHRSLLQKLTAARQPGQPAPWVFTTNYDLAIEWAAESINLKVINGFDGVHRRVFSPHNFDLGWRNVLARGEARFGTYHVYLAKVHGSLSWMTESDGSVVELASSTRWPAFEKLSSGAADSVSGLLVLPSAGKYVQTVGFVLGELLRRLAEFLGRPQTALVTNGYSFSDEHLNRLLVTALQNPTLQLVMYLPEARRVGSDLDLGACSGWAQKVLALQSPQVTIVGGGRNAFFDALAEDLPDPAIYDEHAVRMRAIIREFSEKSSTNEGGNE